MIKLKNSVSFDPNSNRMKIVTDIVKAVEEFKTNKNKNLEYLLSNRFSWMKKFISENDNGLEVGAGAGFSKKYIKNKNFKICDFASFDHLDLKNIDAQKTGLNSESYEFIIASNMLHHVPFPIKFLNEMHRILKPGGTMRTVWPPYEFVEKLVSGEELTGDEEHFVAAYHKFYVLQHKFAGKGHGKRSLREQCAIGLLYQQGQHLYVWSENGIYNNKTLDMKFENNVRAKYEESELFAEKAEYSNTGSYLSIYNNVRINDIRGSLIADKLLFDIKKQKLDITSFNKGKINANVKLDEKRF